MVGSAFECNCGGKLDRIPELTEKEMDELEDYESKHPFDGEWGAFRCPDCGKIHYIGFPEQPEYPAPELYYPYDPY